MRFNPLLAAAAASVLAVTPATGGFAPSAIRPTSPAVPPRVGGKRLKGKNKQSARSAWALARSQRGVVPTGGNKLGRRLARRASMGQYGGY